MRSNHDFDINEKNIAAGQKPHRNDNKYLYLLQYGNRQKSN